MFIEFNSILYTQFEVEKEWGEKPSQIIKQLLKEEAIVFEVYKQEPMFIENNFVSLLNKKLLSNKQLKIINDNEKLFALIVI